MECTHETRNLIGTAEGIQCRACGKTFKTFAEIHANAERQPAAEKKTTKKGGKKDG